MANVDFRVVPQPQTVGQNIQQGIQGLAGLGQVMEERDARQKAEAFAKSPVNPLQQQMLELVMGGKRRIEAGEDPAKVSAELKEHPIAQQYRQAAQGGGLAAPAMGQAQAPQQAAPQPQPQPQVEAPPPPPAYPPGYGQPGQSLGAPPQRVPPQNVSGAYNMGQPPPTQAPMARLSAAPQMTGNTQPPRQEFGSQPAMSLGQSPPPMGPPPAPPQAAAPQPAPYVPTQRDYASVSPMFPTVMAAQGRNDAAQIRADVQRENSIRQNDTATFSTLLRQKGMDADRASREAIEFAKLDEGQRKNVLDNLTRVQTTGMRANADRDVAGINAGSRERVAEGGNDSRERVAGMNVGSREKIAATKASGKGSSGKDELGAQIKALRSQISGLGRADTITAPKGTQESLDRARAELAELEKVWKERNLGALPQASAQGPTFAPAAPSKPRPQPVGGGKIKVRLKNGKPGLISPQFFNPATMTKE